MAEEPQAGRSRAPVIGLITSTVEDKYENALLQGVMAGLQPADAALVCFSGGGVHSYHGFGAQGNVVYSLATRERIDGVILSGTLGHTAGRADLAEFVRPFAPLPIVSVALDIPNVPFLITDSYRGMVALIDHLVTAHGLRRVAFICGPADHPEAEDRYRAYRDVLAAKGIPFAAELVVSGDFSQPAGEDAMVALLARGVLFDAVAAANDTMALGALSVLRQRGYRVPEDVALVGFDDAEAARFCQPSLTTVRQFVFAHGLRAAAMMLDLLAGRQVPMESKIEGRVILRRSCGCESVPAPIAASIVPQGSEDDGSGIVRREIARAPIASLLGSFFPRELAETWTEAITTAEIAAQAGEEGDFLAVWTRILHEASLTDTEVGVWHRVLLVLEEMDRRNPAALRQNLWPAARRLVSEVLENRQLRQRIAVERRAGWLRQIADGMILCRNLSELLEIIARYLPQMGVRRFYLSLYEDPQVPTEGARLVLGLGANGRLPLPASGRHFPATGLVPAAEWRLAPEHAGVVVPLYAQENQLGFAVFMLEPEETAVCDPLRGLISSALQNVMLRQQVENALARRTQESEMRFARIFHSSPVAISISSLENGRYLEVNERFLQMLEYTQQEVIGRTAAELNTWADLRDRERIIQQLRSEGAVRQGEVSFRTKSGRIGFALTSIERIELAGNVLLISMFHDITARKEAENVREALIAELEAKNAELERFTYTVSHDLKSPLVTIKGFLGFVEQDARAGDLQRLEEDLLRIREAADTMQDLLQDLLELSRIGRLINPPVSVPFAELVTEAMQRVQGQLVARRVQVRVMPEMPVVYGDRPRLVELLQNLIDNGIKFMGEQAEPVIEIGYGWQEKTPVFFVRDNGVGIGEAYQQQVFELFERLHTEVEGTGVGLALAKRIVEVHNGRIWVESDGPEQGSTFYFTLNLPLRSFRSSDEE